MPKTLNLEWNGLVPFPGSTLRSRAAEQIILRTLRSVDQISLPLEITASSVTDTVSHILPLSNPESNGYRHLAEFWLGQSDR
jgi:hypothetical protein